MPGDGERIASLEARMDDVEADVATLASQTERSRARLHDLEGFAQAYLEVQKVHRRQEERQYRRLANAIQIGGLAMTAGLLILGAITLALHIG